MNANYKAWDHADWKAAGLKDFCDFSDCIEYINQSEYEDASDYDEDDEFDYDDEDCPACGDMIEDCDCNPCPACGADMLDDHICSANDDE